MKTGSNFIIALCTGAAVLTLAACGSAATPTTVPTVAPTTAPAATTAPKATEAATTAAAKEPARPSNAGGPGPAIKLKGDVAAGAKVFVDSCKKCHGDAGTTGIDNPGSTDGTIPNLNPIDDTLVDKDPVVFATNIDLFIEHGSTPGGSKPKEVMDAWGDQKKLTPQQIADVIAYIISLNPAK